jgi:hypothetical protein
MENFDGLLWLLLMLGPLLFTQRWLHREMMWVFLLLTRREDIAITVFSLLFIPGVFLHEASHFIAARLLGVRTGKFSLLPSTTKDGRLRLGYVQTASTDIFRDALIGTAPLITGGLFVTYSGFVQLKLSRLWISLSQSDFDSLIDGLVDIYNQPDFWLWFYLTLAVSSTMMPSASDRKAWLPLIFVSAILVILGVLFGGGRWMLERMAPMINEMLRSSVVVIGVSLTVHVSVLFPTSFLRRILSRMASVEVR